MRRKDANQDDLRGHVAAALLRLLGDRELSQVAVKELAAEAGVSRSTFYRLVEGKDHVVSWWSGPPMAGYVRLFAGRGDHGREGYLRAIFDCFDAHRDDLLLLHRRGCTHLMLGVFRDRLADGRMSYASAYHVGGIYGVMEQWLDNGMADAPERMAAEALAIMPSNFTPSALAKARSLH